MQELIATFNLNVSITYVRSEVNRADELTRVRKGWLHSKAAENTCNVAVQDMHAGHHFGVDRALHLAHIVDRNIITRGEVERCVKKCEKCQSIAPGHVKKLLKNLMTLLFDMKS